MRALDLHRIRRPCRTSHRGANKRVLASTLCGSFVGLLTLRQHCALMSPLLVLFSRAVASATSSCSCCPGTRHTNIGPFMCFAVENESSALPTCAVPHCVSLSPKLPPSSPPSPVCYLPMYYYTMTNHTMSLCISICQLLLND